MWSSVANGPSCWVRLGGSTKKYCLIKYWEELLQGLTSHSSRAGASETLSPPEVKIHLISLTNQPDLNFFFFSWSCVRMSGSDLLWTCLLRDRVPFFLTAFISWHEETTTRDVSFMACPRMIWDRKFLSWNEKAVFYWVSEASYRKRVISTIKIMNGSQSYSKVRNSIWVYEL